MEAGTAAEDRCGVKDPLVVRWTIAFVRWFCPESLIEGIEGDLLEDFRSDVLKKGRSRAVWRLIWSALKFFRFSIIMRNRTKFKNPSLIMLNSYFKLTVRNISRSKGYSFITIFGLSLGIACCLLTTNYVVFETSFDNFHPNAERTYRVDQTMIWRPDGGMFGFTGLPLAQLLTNDYPEVEEAMRINLPGDNVVRYAPEGGNEMIFNEKQIYAVDSNFFHFFGFRLKEGDPNTALKGLNKVVINEEVAKKFFGDGPALGEILQLGNDRTPLEVSGVAETLPDNTHFKFNYLMSMYTNPNIKEFEWSWIWTQSATYVRLKPGADPSELQQKMARVGEETIKPSFQRFGINYDDFMNGKGDWTFYFMPMRDIHLKSSTAGVLGSVGDIRYVYTFGAIGIFVLTIAAINFVNLSTARGTKRAREVGVKKALGALRSSLISQFQAESVFLALFSMLLAIPLLEGLRSLIVVILKDDMPFRLWSNPMFLAGLPVFAISIGFLAGLYPAFYLTSFLPVQVLKGKVASGMGNSSLRSTLVVIQFAISILLLVGTVVVVQQMNFLRSADLGYNKENTLIINYAQKLDEHIESFRNEIVTVPGVVGAAIAQDVPRGSAYQDIYTAEGTSIKLPVHGLKIDDYYLDAMGFQLIAGRKFDLEHNASDRTAYIANETAVQLFGWTPEEAIGKIVIFPFQGEVKHEVIGVVKNFHFESLKSPINPLFFSHITSRMWGSSRVMAIKYRTDDLPGLIGEVERRWNETVDLPLDFSFLEDDLAWHYREDQKLGDIFGIFAILSIIIAMIGLVGLVAYSAEVKKKEIGIRKVLGATRVGIVVMMNSNYVKLIAIGLVIATPIAWFAMNYWLETFEFRITISPMVFVMSGLAVLAGALGSVGYLSLRAASVNPASVLKDE